MKKKIILMGALLSLSYGSAHASGPIVEKWSGSIGGGEGDLTITTTRAGLVGTLDIGAPGCGGGLSGPVVENADLIILLGNEAKSPTCFVKFRKQGNRITGGEPEGDCMVYHGAACDFSDPSMKRVK